MKKLILFLIMCVSTTWSQKQTIESAEYFIGRDPGEGNGTPLTIQQGDASSAIDWKTAGMPALTPKDLIYVRVKSSGFTDVNGNPVRGKWSFPVGVKLTTSNFIRGSFYSTAVLLNAEVRLIRPSLGYPLKKVIFPVDSSFDQAVEQLCFRITVDSLQAGDTLMIRLQGKDEIWGAWKQLAIRQEYMQLPKPFNLAVVNKTQTAPFAELTWSYSSSGQTGFSVERRKSGGAWSEIAAVGGDERMYQDITGMSTGDEYCWRIRAKGVKSIMISDYSNEACQVLTSAENPSAPSTVSLEQNYPNPFLDKTQISFSISAPGSVTLVLLDVAGHEVSRLIDNQYLLSGPHMVMVYGSSLSPGLYFLTMTTKYATLTRSMTVVR
jgi:hypothetical protein